VIASANTDYATFAPFATDPTNSFQAAVFIEGRQERNLAEGHDGLKLTPGRKHIRGDPSV
jgi:hypothetical protein